MEVALIEAISQTKWLSWIIALSFGYAVFDTGKQVVRLGWNAWIRKHLGNGSSAWDRRIQDKNSGRDYAKNFYEAVGGNSVLIKELATNSKNMTDAIKTYADSNEKVSIELRTLHTEIAVMLRTMVDRR